MQCQLGRLDSKGLQRSRLSLIICMRNWLDCEEAVEETKSLKWYKVQCCSIRMRHRSIPQHIYFAAINARFLSEVPSFVRLVRGKSSVSHLVYETAL